MASKTDIANMALTHIGVGFQISNLDADTSEEAKAIRSFYITARDFMQIDFPWPFITRSVALGLVEETPTTEWAFSYRYPAPCQKVRRIFSSIRNDNRQTRVSYLIYSDDVGKLIYTDAEDACIEYSVKSTEEDKWPADYVLAFSYLLAFYVAPRLTKGDAFKMGEKAFKLYRAQLAVAEQRSLNEEQPDPIPESEFVRSRNGDDFGVPGTSQSAVEFTS